MEEASLGESGNVSNTSSKNSNGGQTVTISSENNGISNGRANYSIPGILHFVQHEWARFEMERANWEVERAELQVASYDVVVFWQDGAFFKFFPLSNIIHTQY